MTEMNALTEEVIGACIEVHRALGPGLLESAYYKCLCYELELRTIHFQPEIALPVKYKALRLDSAYRIDLLIENCLVIELKAVEKIIPVHKAQLLTYLRLGNWPVGLLINFNVPVLKDGITRLVHDFKS
jgi:GxxExxY protein